VISTPRPGEPIRRQRSFTWLADSSRSSYSTMRTTAPFTWRCFSRQGDLPMPGVATHQHQRKPGTRHRPARSSSRSRWPGAAAAARRRRESAGIGGACHGLSPPPVSPRRRRPCRLRGQSAQGTACSISVIQPPQLDKGGLILARRAPQLWQDVEGKRRQGDVMERMLAEDEPEATRPFSGRIFDSSCSDAMTAFPSRQGNNPSRGMTTPAIRQDPGNPPVPIDDTTWSRQ